MMRMLRARMNDGRARVAAALLLVALLACPATLMAPSRAARPVFP